MSNVIIPFDHHPVAIVQSGSSYTPAAGKYARAVVNYTTDAYVTSWSHSNPGGGAATYSPGNTSGSSEFWIGSGDTIAVSFSVASGTDSGTGASFSSTRSSSVVVTINGNTVAAYVVHSSMHFSGGSGNWIVSNSGTANAYIAAEEYVIPT